MRSRLIGGLAVLLVVAFGLTASRVFDRTGNAVAMWTAAILLWPAYLLRFAVAMVFRGLGSRRFTLPLLAITATLYYLAIATATILATKRVAAAVLALHAAATILIGWFMVQLLDLGRGMEALQD